MKDTENIKTITKSSWILENLAKLETTLIELGKKYKYVWNIELLKDVEIPIREENLSHTSRFILVSNILSDPHTIHNFLQFKKRRRKISFNNIKFRFLEMAERFPVLEIVDSLKQKCLQCEFYNNLITECEAYVNDPQNCNESKKRENELKKGSE